MKCILQEEWGKRFAQKTGKSMDKAVISVDLLDRWQTAVVDWVNYAGDCHGAACPSG